MIDCAGGNQHETQYKQMKRSDVREALLAGAVAALALVIYILALIAL